MFGAEIPWLLALFRVVPILLLSSKPSEKLVLKKVYIIWEVSALNCPVLQRNYPQTYLATLSSIRSRNGMAMEGLWWTNVDRTTMHKLRVSSSNCSSEIPHSGHQSRSRSLSKGSFSALLSRVLSKDRVESPGASRGLEPLLNSLTESEPSMLPDLLMSTSRVSWLVVESTETR